jgi:hypothetical protein
MASIGLSEAARLTGRNQSTIHRAMKTGRLSYTKDAAGERRIDTAELDRVFGMRHGPNGASAGSNGATADAMAQPVASHVTHEPASERIIARRSRNRTQRFATCAQGSMPRPRSGGG